jgi:hypothetical protein
MKQELIRDLAITGGIYDCICDPYDKLKNGDPYSSVMIDLERFAEKIVRECAKVADDGFASSNFGNGITGHQLLKHFGVDE